MRTISSANTTHLAEEVTTLAVCWCVTRTDGVAIRGTEHDNDLIIPDIDGLGGTYKAAAGITGSSAKYSSDMSVDNMEVSGALSTDGIALLDVRAVDVEAGLMDDAEVSLFLINWEDPANGPIRLQSGIIGEIRRDTDGGYTTELRGLTQKLVKIPIRTYGASCDAELGDARCKMPIASTTFAGVIVAVHNNRSFTVEVSVDTSTTEFEPGYFEGGKVKFVSGNCTDFEMEVKTCVLDVTVNEVTLYLPMPADVQVGDTFTIRPGCDKSPAMCKGRFNNLVNYRGHGTWCPGIGAMGIFGGQTPSKPVAGAAPLNPALIWPRPSS